MCPYLHGCRSPHDSTQQLSALKGTTHYPSQRLGWRWHMALALALALALIPARGGRSLARHRAQISCSYAKLPVRHSFLHLDRHIARTAVCPAQATTLMPHFSIAPVPRKLGRAGVVHWACNTLDARHCLAALAWLRVTLCKIGEKTACKIRLRVWHRRRRRGHGRNWERLEWAIFVATAI